jgi:hypothetical protein
MWRSCFCSENCSRGVMNRKSNAGTRMRDTPGATICRPHRSNYIYSRYTVAETGRFRSTEHCFSSSGTRPTGGTWVKSPKQQKIQPHKFCLCKKKLLHYNRISPDTTISVLLSCPSWHGFSNCGSPLLRDSRPTLREQPSSQELFKYNYIETFFLSQQDLIYS